MTTTLTLLGVILVIGAMAYRRASLFTSTLATAAALIVGTLYGHVPLLVWALFVVIAIPLNLVDFRRNQLTKPLFKLYKSIMPEMSRTEKEAIEAGTTWWEADLFAGNPNWKKLHAIPVSTLSAEEQAFMDGPVEEVCRMVNDWEVTHERADLSPEVWQYLKDHKFFAMIIKKKYGGLEFSAYAQSCVLQKLCGASAVLASTVGVPNSLGPGELLQHYGTDEQKDYYLPRLAVGKEIPCFALTSPEAGSDAGSIPDFGIIAKGEWEGEEVLGMRLTWNKRYITLAPIATVLGLAFKLRDPDHLLGDEEELGITCALIPTHIKGVEIGRRHFPLNVPFQNGPTRGKDVFVPLDFIIGGPAMAGQGWRMLVECLSVGRGITLPSNSTGGVKMLALATGAYSRIRRQFKLPIGKMEGIEEPLARLGGNAYIMGAAANLTVTGIDLGEKPSVISAIVKYHLTDRAQKCIIDAMDIHGGKAICMGPNNYLARGYQGAPIAVTVEGANILTRSMIIYGQGAIRCHPYVLPEMLAASHPDQEQALKDFDKAMFSHVGFAISNLVRSFWLGLTGARFAAAPFKDQTKGYYQQLSRLSANLAFLSDMAMGTLGGELKRKERVSARLGDVLSQLYLASSALKRYQDEGRQHTDLPLLHWALQDALFKAQEAIDELLRNFPNRWIGLALRVIVLPLGRDLKRPSDRLDSQVARLLQTPSETRSRLAQGQYLTREEGNPFGLLEQALDDVLSAEPLFEKVCKADGIKRPFMQLDKVAEIGLAQGVLNQTEADLLRRAEESRLHTINVDDFDPIDLVANKALFEPSAYHRAA
ncbi:TPA: acyl-CoA dehydrogenase FadE [Aeromonas hydrophila]|uniref:acyl-CoA dehydrogenase FadE n=1 Tax=Aeromonas hydrophila TaxID=644 RepID=UPI000446B229|nr:acyl-CoA dehydrogenase FadE [Aeromonas hydrophila]HDT5891012.1 acyl-CoA dehydrogenase FadE [Aeromonas hydrophila subsp. hydrophila]EZH82763.1 acyl-CoA dehydrogenase [Aeromonas hydrophila AD9]KHE13442.1 acyl-CoA dehydrogenase [Aeromonas hydrophila]MCV3292060.1 acyl-CoA dehydrogenase FadE [Aeromonas hydrophila]OSP51270.1 acyl-CoA dehydrogenase [Aeromonas hydrophila]